MKPKRRRLKKSVKKNIRVTALAMVAVMLVSNISYFVNAADQPDSQAAIEANDVTDTEAQPTTLEGKDADGKYNVTLTADTGVIPDGSAVQVIALKESDEKYSEAKTAVTDAKKAEDQNYDVNTLGFSALDISIIDKDGNIIEPNGNVNVSIKLNELPEGVEAGTSLEVQHIKDTDETTTDADTATAEAAPTVDTVAENVEAKDDGSTEATFDVDSFSTFTITWQTTGLGFDKDITVHYVDHNGKDIEGPQSDPVSVNGDTTLQMSEYAKDIDGYVFEGAHISSYDGTEFDTIQFTYKTILGATLRSTATFYKDNQSVFEKKWNENWTDDGGRDIYLVYDKGTKDTVTLDDGTIIEFTWGQDSNIPETAKGYGLVIKETDDEYQNYVSETNDLVYVGDNEHSVDWAKYFDVSLQDDKGNEYQPADGTAVKVRIKTDGADKITGDVNIIHFKSDDSIEMIPAERDDDGYIVYYQQSFSRIGLFNAPQVKAAPTVLASSDDTEGPGHSKTLKDNGDGTYDLTLSVTGKASSSSESTKADVVIVYDISGSMKEPADNTSDTGMYGKGGDDYIQLYKRELTGYDSWNYPIYSYTAITNEDNYTGTVYYHYYDDYYEYSYTRYSSNSDKTRLQAANEAITNTTNGLAKTLLDQNGGNTDSATANVTLSLVTFSDTATTVINETADLDTFNNGIPTTATGGTNWEDALIKANDIQPRKYTENGQTKTAQKYVIFVSDGDPTYRVQSHDGYQTSGNHTGKYVNDPDEYYYSFRRFIKYDDVPNGAHGSGRGDPNGWNYSDAASVAKSIGSNFYGLGVFGNVSNMQNLVTASGADSSTHYFSVNNSADLQTALSRIANSISNSADFRNVTVTDNITNLTSTALVNGQIDGMTVKVTDNAGKDVTNTEKVSNPIYTEDGTGQKVTWSLGENYHLKDGYTYSATFKVWPSQEAYDTIAKLNNGETIDGLTFDDTGVSNDGQIVRSGPEGNYSYSLRTNTSDGNTVTYTRVDTKTENGHTTTEEHSGSVNFTNPDPVSLDKSQITVNKKFVNNLDDRKNDEVKLTLKQDSTVAKENIVLNSGNGFTNHNVYVAPGLIQTGGSGNSGYTVLETGHDYTFDESGDKAYRWSLETAIYRPMVIGNTLTMLKKVDSAPTSGTYYQIDGWYYVPTNDSEAQITLTNYRQSDLNLTKVAIGNKGSNDSLFTFDITVTDANGSDVWFSIEKSKDSNGNSVFATSEDGLVVKSGDTTLTPNSSGYYSVTSGTKVTVTMKPTWNLRFINLPVGSTYSITESQADGYIFKDAKVTVGNNQTQGDYPEDKGNATLTGTKVTGTITQTNHKYIVTYTNQAGEALPNTGGTGTKLIYTLGAILVALATLLYLRKKKAN